MGTTKKGSDPSRADRKAKKRKLEDAIPDLPGDDEPQEITTSDDKSSKKRKRAAGEISGDNDLADDKERKSAKKEKREKKQKRNAEDSLLSSTEGVKAADGKGEAITDEPKEDVSTKPEVPNISEDGPKKSKKERKAERKAREAIEKVEKEASKPADLPKENSTSIEDKGGNTSTKLAGSEEKKPRKNNRNREKKRWAALQKGTEEKAPRFIAFIGNTFSAPAASQCMY